MFGLIITPPDVPQMTLTLCSLTHEGPFKKLLLPVHVILLTLNIASIIKQQYIYKLWALEEGYISHLTHYYLYVEKENMLYKNCCD